MGHCDECGGNRETRQIYWDPPQGMEFHVCRECYNEAPEPDTGRPDWEDIKSENAI